MVFLIAVVYCLSKAIHQGKGIYRSSNMVVSSSCEFGQLRPSSPNLSQSFQSKAILNGRIIKISSSIDHFASSLFVTFLFVALLLATSHLQCSESKTQEVRLISDPFNVLEPNQDEVACFCKGKFYQTCPPKQSGCILRKKPKVLKITLSSDPYELHDSKHPDHVDKLESVREMWPSSRPVKLKSVQEVWPTSRPWNSMIRSAPSFANEYNGQTILSNEAESSLNLGDIETRDNERVVRHRKVYVAEKLAEQEPIIHPIELTIPVKIKKEQDPPLPPPKPVFRLHKYTTYETRPEIEMVPITTTVIKPVGVTEDQIIDYKKSDKI